MAIHYDVCGLVLLALVTAASAQLDCFECSFSYVDSTTVDSANCGTVSFSLTRVNSFCYGSCYTAISLNDGGIQINRGCDRRPTDCNNCTDPEHCKICCTSADNCNSDSLSSILSSKSLTQTCYKCRYSQIPGVHSDDGCGLNFDATSLAVYSTECPGMCYSSRSLIPGVEDVTRGCSYFGNECDYEDNKEVVRTAHDLVQHRVSCCMGDKCNRSTSLSMGLTAIIIGSFLVIIF